MTERQDEVDSANKQEPRNKDGTFAVGNSGGPGRPKGSLSITTLMRNRLESFAHDGKRQLVDEFIDTILNKALVDGDVQMQKEIWHYIDGLPHQRLDFGVDKENIGDLTAILTGLAKKDDRNEHSDGETEK